MRTISEVFSFRSVATHDDARAHCGRFQRNEARKFEPRGQYVNRRMRHQFENAGTRQRTPNASKKVCGATISRRALVTECTLE